jgi:hypothetical protein
MLQVAVQDIGHLTDIYEPPGKSSRSGTQMSVSPAGTDLADSQATVTAIQIPGGGRFDDRAQHDWGQPS